MWAAIVDETIERGADLLVVGLPYRKQFGGGATRHRPDHPLYPPERAVHGLGGARPDRGDSVKIVIVGCGRVGASAAEAYDQTGHEVVILDIVLSAFDRLPQTFRGKAIRGDGTDGGVLRRVSTQGRDAHRRDRGRQPEHHGLGTRQRGPRDPTVIAKVDDQVRAKAYAELGITTICRTGGGGRRGPLPRPVFTTSLRELLAWTATRHELQVSPPRPGTGCWSGPVTMTPPPDPAAAVRQEPEPCSCSSSARGKVGYYLTKELLASGHEVALIEKDDSRVLRSRRAGQDRHQPRRL